MNKHPDCADRCHILEHKGYRDCSQTGRCELLEATDSGEGMPKEPELISELRSGVSVHDNPNLKREWGEELLQAWDALSLRERGEWIPVSERLPDEEINVLVHTGKNQCDYTAEYTAEG